MVLLATVRWRGLTGIMMAVRPRPSGSVPKCAGQAHRVLAGWDVPKPRVKRRYMLIEIFVRRRRAKFFSTMGHSSSGNRFADTGPAQGFCPDP